MSFPPTSSTTANCRLIHDNACSISPRARSSPPRRASVGPSITESVPCANSFISKFRNWRYNSWSPLRFALSWSTGSGGGSLKDCISACVKPTLRHRLMKASSARRSFSRARSAALRFRSSSISLSAPRKRSKPSTRVLPHPAARWRGVRLLGSKAFGLQPKSKSNSHAPSWAPRLAKCNAVRPLSTSRTSAKARTTMGSPPASSLQTSTSLRSLFISPKRAA
mmetsp:Transcript_45924/g.58984  ORF Transcript_45924/g.58984 Transcript_45924/m.58984 type:complete len:223 (-) Transcript_45924:752-1420(-)